MVTMIPFEGLVFNLSMFTLFGVIHSLTASKTIKDFIPLDNQYYRLFYNFLNSALFLIILLIVPLPEFIQFELNVFTIISSIFMVLGSMIFLWGAYSWDISEFLGFSKESKKLITDRAYRFSRHPVYSGIIAILLGLVIGNPTMSNISWLLGGGGYFVLGSIPEENKLKNIFGSSYLQYKQNAGRIFPYRSCHFRFLLSGEYNCTE